jgi:hypothetical protein
MRRLQPRGGFTVKYCIDYRYLAKGAAEPTDNTEQVDVEVEDNQFALVPNVGDYVDIPGDRPGMRNVPLRGKVRSRLFHYRLRLCYVTIIVEDCDEDWCKIGKV